MTSELRIYREETALRHGAATAPAIVQTACRIIGEAGALILAQAKRIERLEALATTDELTGLHNRRGFFQALAAELDRCSRDLSYGGLLVFIDADNFREICGAFGPAAGDACLRLLASTLQLEVRCMDTAARLGPDEFVLLLSNATKKEAAGRLQQFGWRLNNLALAWCGDIVPVRAGLELREYGKGDTPEIVFPAADIANYRAGKARRERAGLAAGR